MIMLTDGFGNNFLHLSEKHDSTLRSCFLRQVYRIKVHLVKNSMQTEFWGGERGINCFWKSSFWVLCLLLYNTFVFTMWILFTSSVTAFFRFWSVVGCLCSNMLLDIIWKMCSISARTAITQNGSYAWRSQKERTCFINIYSLALQI